MNKTYDELSEYYGENSKKTKSNELFEKINRIWVDFRNAKVKLARLRKMKEKMVKSSPEKSNQSSPEKAKKGEQNAFEHLSQQSSKQILAELKQLQE